MSRYSNLSNPGTLLREVLFRRAVIFGLLILAALLAFETFNYSTTEFALNDVLGDLRFLGVRWATILAIAFCCIDFAGVARLFTPERGADEPVEVWYLFGAWLLAAGMNALLTWWGVSVAIANHQSMGNAVINQATLLKIVPVFVAIMVWVTRVLIIGTFAVAGEHLFDLLSAKHKPSSRPVAAISTQAGGRGVQPLTFGRSINNGTQAAFKPVPKASPPPEPEPTYSRPEPTYHPVSARPASSANPSRSNPATRR